MAELIIPFARRSGAVRTAHLMAGLMARGAGRAFAGFAKRMAARRTIAQLSALDDRTLHDIGLHRSEIASRGPTLGPLSAGASIQRDLLNAVVDLPLLSQHPPRVSRSSAGSRSVRGIEKTRPLGW